MFSSGCHWIIELYETYRFLLLIRVSTSLNSCRTLQSDRAQILRHQSSPIRNPTSFPRSSSKEEMNRRGRRWINRKRCLPQHCLHGFAADFKGFLERNVTIRAATRSERTRTKYYRRFHTRAINFILHCYIYNVILYLYCFFFSTELILTLMTFFEEFSIDFPWLKCYKCLN